MTTQLQHIADIQFGISVETSDKGSIICFQVKNLSHDGNLKLDTLLYTNDSEIDKSSFLQPGDILLPAKGSKLSAAIISEEEAFMTVASSSLFVIRITSKEIISGYLQWFLNLPHTQWQLEKEATGTNIPSLSIRYLRKLKIEVPDLETQKKIVQLNKLLQKEKELTESLSAKKATLIETVTKNLISKN